MYATQGNAQRARWEVIWRGTKRLVHKDFESDLASALELRDKLIAGGRTLVTLRCMNMGFAPPDKWADHDEEPFEILERVVRVKVGGRVRNKVKRYKKPLPPELILPRTYRVRMHGANVKGAWWCPYCIKMRRFVKRGGTPNTEILGTYDGSPVAWKMPERDEPHMACPVCNVSHRDANVMHYNPLALRYVNMRRERSDKGTTRG